MAGGGGVDAVRNTYASYQAAKPGEDTTGDAIALGFQWLSSGRAAEALVLFQLNAEAHPDHVLSQFNLGEAYRYTAQPDLAVAQYQRVLELAPDHPQAAARIELVTGG